MLENLASFSEFEDIDWYFSGTSAAEGLAGFHWYPARYVPDLPGTLIAHLSKPGDLILDPYCGSGTTLVEAYRAGRRSIGVDINPIGILATQAKVAAFDAVSFRKHRLSLADAVTERLYEGLGDSWQKSVPNYDENASWFHPETLRELAAIWSAIHASGSEYGVVDLATFSASLRSCCSQLKHWGWICDNVKPKQLVYRPAFNTFLDRLSQFEASRSELAGQVEARESFTPRAVTGACEIELAGLADESVDMVMTSPPYFGMTDYVRAQRLSFLWFEYDLDSSRRFETGARYKRFRKTALAQYMASLGAGILQMGRVLKPGAWCVLVVGESSRRESFVSDLEAMLAAGSLKVEGDIPRYVPVQRSMSSESFQERIMIARKV